MDRRSLANDPDALARMLFQPELSCFLPYLILMVLVREWLSLAEQDEWIRTS